MRLRCNRGVVRAPNIVDERASITDLRRQPGRQIPADGFRQSRIVRLEGTLGVGAGDRRFWLEPASGSRAARPPPRLAVRPVDRSGCRPSALCLSLPFFTSAWASRVLLLREMKGVWDDLLTPFGKSLTLAEIAALAALSGISEEIFFRGAVQGEIGIVGASVLFGLLHPLNLSYVIWASGRRRCVRAALPSYRQPDPAHHLSRRLQPGRSPLPPLLVPRREPRPALARPMKPFGSPERALPPFSLSCLRRAPRKSC